MNKICGYSCEHNKSGVCQISICDKKTYMSDKTEIKHLSQSYYDLHEKYYKLQQENKRLKDNWNKLKEIMEEETREYWDTNILEIMQELEQGRDRNETV